VRCSKTAKKEGKLGKMKEIMMKFGVRLKVFDLSFLSQNIFFYGFNNLFIP